VTTNAKPALIEHEEYEVDEEEVLVSSFNSFYINALDEEIMNLIRMQSRVISRIKKILSNGSNGVVRITEDLNNE